MIQKRPGPNPLNRWFGSFYFETSLTALVCVERLDALNLTQAGAFGADVRLLPLKDTLIRFWLQHPRPQVATLSTVVVVLEGTILEDMHTGAVTVRGVVRADVWYVGAIYLLAVGAVIGWFIIPMLSLILLGMLLYLVGVLWGRRRFVLRQVRRALLAA